MITAESSGPTVNSSSIETPSRANAVESSSSRRRSSSGHSARIAEPIAGTAKPPTSAQTTSASVGASASVSAISRPVELASTMAIGSSTARWPKRSISRLCTGTPIAAPIPKAPSTRPATA